MLITIWYVINEIKCLQNTLPQYVSKLFENCSKPENYKIIEIKDRIRHQCKIRLAQGLLKIKKFLTKVVNKNLKIVICTILLYIQKCNTLFQTNI